MGGVAEPGNTSESARSGILFTFTPGVSAVETGVEFFTANMPEPDPEKLSRIFTGVLPSAAKDGEPSPQPCFANVTAFSNCPGVVSFHLFVTLPTFIRNRGNLRCRPNSAFHTT